MIGCRGRRDRWAVMLERPRTSGSDRGSHRFVIGVPGRTLRSLANLLRSRRGTALSNRRVLGNRPSYPPSQVQFSEGVHRPRWVGHEPASSPLVESASLQPYAYAIGIGGSGPASVDGGTAKGTWQGRALPHPGPRLAPFGDHCRRRHRDASISHRWTRHFGGRRQRATAQYLDDSGSRHVGQGAPNDAAATDRFEWESDWWGSCETRCPVELEPVAAMTRVRRTTGESFEEVQE